MLSLQVHHSHRSKRPVQLKTEKTQTQVDTFTSSAAPLRLLPKSFQTVPEQRFTPEEQALLELDYQSFDQSLPDGGWRAYVVRGENRKAGLLLEAYLTKHDGLREGQKRILHFHAGQTFAAADSYPRAIENFEQSFNENEPPDARLLWNDYVHATIGFLKGDLETVKRSRERIANGPTMPDGTKGNLAVVDRLLDIWGKPYSEAY